MASGSRWSFTRERVQARHHALTLLAEDALDRPGLGEDVLFPEQRDRGALQGTRTAPVEERGRRCEPIDVTLRVVAAVLVETGAQRVARCTLALNTVTP